MIRVLLFFLLYWPACGMTLIKREMFDEGATNNAYVLTNGALGSLGGVTNRIQCVAYGASTNGGLPWSGLIQRTNGVGSITFTNKNYLFSAWYRFAQFAVNTSDQAVPDTYAQGARFFCITSTGHGDRVIMSVGGAGTLFYNDFTVSTNIWTLTNNVWQFIAVGISNSSSSTQVRVYLGTNMTCVLTNVATTFSDMTNCKFGTGLAAFGNSGSQWSGRISGVSVHQILTNFSDVAYPADLIPPSDSSETFYVNPATGSDSFDGRSAAAPWGNNSSRVYEALKFGWVKGSTNEWSGGTDDTNFANGLAAGTITTTGDRLLFNTDSAPFLLTNQLRFFNAANGVTLGSYGTGKARFNAAKQLYGFTASATVANVLEITDTDNQSVLWQDWKWMNSPTGATFASVSNSLSTVPGSFWTDGTKMYCNPIGGTTNGSEFWRSQKLLDVNTATAAWTHTFYLTGGGVALSNLNVYGNAIRSPTNGASDVLYAINLAGTNRTAIIDSDFRHGGNHTHGSVHGDLTNFISVYIRSSFGHGAPTNWGQAYSTMVEHCTTVGTDRRAIYFGVNWATNGVIGSAVGTNTGGTWLSHGAVTNTNSYTLMWFSNCIGGTMTFASEAEYMVRDGGLKIEDSTLYTLTPGASKPVINRCTILDQLGDSDKGGAISHSTMGFVNGRQTGGQTLSNGWTFINCTLDASRMALGVATDGGIIVVAPGASLAVTNCILIIPTTNRYSMFTNGIISYSRNLCYGTAGMIGLTNGNIYADPRIDSQYRLLGDSPARGAGVDLGVQFDFTKQLFGNRRDIGAIQRRAQGSFRF